MTVRYGCAGGRGAGTGGWPAQGDASVPLRGGCAGGRGAGTGGWPARGDASVPLPRRPAPAPTRLARALQKTLSLRERPHTLPGGPVSEEMFSLLLQHARLSGYGSHFFATSVCLRDDL